MADRPGSAYRDELGAAHARIAELEARLRERDKLGEGSKLLPRLREQKALIDRRIRDSHIRARLAVFGAVVWLGLGLLVHWTQPVGNFVPMIAAVLAYVAISSSRRERQLKSDGTVLDENIAEAEQLFARAVERPTTVPVRVDLDRALESAGTAQSPSEPERADERRDDHHEHPGGMSAR